MEMLLERRSNIFREQEEHTKFIMSVKIVAKIAIDNMKKLPRIIELNAEYAMLLERKKSSYLLSIISELSTIAKKI